MNPDRFGTSTKPVRRSITCFAALGALALLAGVIPDAMADQTMKAKVTALAPELEAYIERGMKDFDLPGLAIGIVDGNGLVYARAFGVRQKGGEPVDTDTVFQIGSTTKAFLATTIAIAVDRKELAWDDRVVDLYPDFQLKDPWVTHEFRVFDLLAQRSGLPPYANDVFGMLGASHDQKIHSLRYVDPVSSFRSSFAYTNITHILAQDIVAKVSGAADWDAVVRSEIFEPLGMASSSLTAEALEAAPNRTWGYRWTPDGTVEVAFTPIFPYGFGGAGAINSTIEDMAHWVRLHLADGAFDGERIVSAENLAATRMARVAVTDKMAYAMGWVIQSTPNGTVTWHNGGTTAFGAYVGMALDRGVGVVVLTNETNVGLPDAIGEWTLDRLMGNPDVDHVAAKLAAAKKGAAAAAALFARPADARPAPPLAPLAGTFASPIFGDVTITVADDGLDATVGATGATLRFDPWNGDIFTVSLVPEGEMAAIAANLGPDPQGFAQFQVDPSGKLSILELTFPENGQTFLLTRRR
jgi:CubicO group peptidase (beta-lactamase class C family)